MFLKIRTKCTVNWQSSDAINDVLLNWLHLNLSQPPGSEDGTIRLWHANTYRLEFTLNYGFERVWCISQLPGSNNLGIGYDEGTIMIKLGREEPAITMDTGGKIIWAKHSEIQQVKQLIIQFILKIILNC